MEYLISKENQKELQDLNRAIVLVVQTIANQLGIKETYRVTSDFSALWTDDPPQEPKEPLENKP